MRWWLATIEMRNGDVKFEWLIIWYLGMRIGGDGSIFTLYYYYYYWHIGRRGGDEAGWYTYGCHHSFWQWSTTRSIEWKEEDVMEREWDSLFTCANIKWRARPHRCAFVDAEGKKSAHCPPSKFLLLGLKNVSPSSLFSHHHRPHQNIYIYINI